MLRNERVGANGSGGPELRSVSRMSGDNGTDDRISTVDISLTHMYCMPRLTIDLKHVKFVYYVSMIQSPSNVDIHMSMDNA